MQKQKSEKNETYTETNVRYLVVALTSKGQKKLADNKSRCYTSYWFTYKDSSYPAGTRVRSDALLRSLN